MVEWFFIAIRIGVEQTHNKFLLLCEVVQFLLTTCKNINKLISLMKVSSLIFILNESCYLYDLYILNKPYIYTLNKQACYLDSLIDPNLGHRYH